MEGASVEAGRILAVLLLCGLVCYASAVDWREMIIPDAANAGIFVAGMLASLGLGTVEPVSAVAAAAVGALLTAAVQAGFRHLRGYDGLGFGDVKFIAAAAAWTGLEGLPFALLGASLAALAYMFGRRAVDRSFELSRPVPFGPFLGVGFVTVAAAQILAGAEILDLLAPIGDAVRSSG